MSSRHLQDVFKIGLQDISSRRLQDMSSRRLQDVLEDVKLLCWRHVEDVFKTCLEDVLKTSSRPTNVCWVVSECYRSRYPLFSCLLQLNWQWSQTWMEAFWIHFSRSSYPEVFCKKRVLRKFAKFGGKHLCQSLSFNKVAGLRQGLQLY